MRDYQIRGDGRRPFYCESGRTENKENRIIQYLEVKSQMNDDYFKTLLVSCWSSPSGLKSNERTNPE